MADPNLLQPEERVLSTLESSGKRRWLRPRLAKGRFLTARRVVAYALIAIFTLIPYLRMPNGKPVLLLNVLEREFIFFGKTFLPTDTFLLALFMVGLLLSIFLVTALFGRVWCGWACPQTVYLEFVYRPIERLFEKTIGYGGKPKRDIAGWRKIARYAVYLVVSMFLAHTFLAYFVGVENLLKWVQGSPVNHPIAFLVMAVTTALMMFDFCYWREQLCIIGCPYGRFQSVLLDRQSLIITYDPVRGEPRGKLKRQKQDRGDGSVALPVVEGDRGDCIDCTMCVQVCPTGIDIRDGLQLECVNCAQCIDACDEVMDKIGKPRGLIRYSSQQAVEGEKPGLLRPRVVIYPLVILLIIGLFIGVLGTKSVASVALLRSRGVPFYELQEGVIGNTVRLELVNRTNGQRAFELSLVDSGPMTLKLAENPLRLEGGERVDQPLQIVAPAEAFEAGVAYATLRITSADDYENTMTVRLMGPRTTNTPTP